MVEARITPVDPTTFELEDYSTSDENLISSVEVSTLFNPSTDYIEYYIYNPNNGGLVFPPSEVSPSYTNYILEDNILVINPKEDLNSEGYFDGNYNTFYNFLSTRLASNFDQRYYISEISSDRTEIRLDSNDISTENIISSSLDFIQERNTDEYYPDFYLNFGNNQLVIANNILLDTSTVLIKLYEPLPPQYQLKSTLWVVEQIADPIAYLVELINTPIIVDNSIKLKGPNLNLKIKGQVNNSTEAINYESLINTSLTSSLQQINSFYEDPSIQINIDYTEFSNFIKFSSAEKRLNNFFYKLGQIESWTDSASSGSGVSIVNSSGSTAYYQNLINETINEFDNYEYYLYYTSGSKSWPKSNSSQPYVQFPTTSSEVQTWITASSATASLYDENNQDWVYYAIPEYLREDSANQPYLDFTNMVGHFYDENIWVYIKDITNKWDNDNRIDSGISRDLIAQQLRDLGFNLYENQFSSFNLFVSTLGLTPSGSYFPFPDMTGSLPTPSGFEYVNNSITGSNEILPQDDVNKRLYKRIYANLSYLYKKKGTVDGIRTLATIYGIPNTLLRIDEFGGKDKDNTNDWDYWFEQFNYKFNTGNDGEISTEWPVIPQWNSQNDVPSSLEFRFKTPGLQSGIDTPNQVLWSLDTDSYIVLEYTGSGYTSGSFNGSISNPYNQYAFVKLVPDFTNYPNDSASVYLPFYNENWWSIAITRQDNEFSLYAANSIYSGSNGSQIGFTATSSVTVDINEYTTGARSYFPSNARADVNSHSAFSGSYQEIRYYATPISYSVFEDYVMNPQSIEGNGINSGSTELIFRGTLGGELYTGSNSIHPKSTGSWTPLDSFGSGNAFSIRGGGFEANREYVFMDQPAVGIKNRITDKIRQVALNLPEGNQQLSNIRSIQQNTETDDAYTNTINQVEVTLSPTNQINDDIIDSLGYFNIGEYIGDPRQINSGSTFYPDLNNLRDDYFLKYTSNYDWNDFIRLIKFFDNSLWKTIKDFIPSKVSAATGISIKQHLLERQKYPEPLPSYTEQEYTGSIGQTPSLLSGSRTYTPTGEFEYISIESITGSQGGALPNFVEGTNHTLDQIVNVTQSWEGSYQTPFGFEEFTQDDAREFVTGEFSGSALLVEDGELNPSNTEKKPTTVTLDYISSGSNNTDPLEGEFYWNYASVESAGNPKQLLGWGVDEMYIHEISNNGVNIESALSNLGPGDQITFTVRTQNEDVFGPSGPPFNRTRTQTISEISQFTNTIWRIKFTGYTTIVSGLIYTPALGLNVNSNTLIDPYINIPNFAYSDNNAILNNEITPRQSNTFYDLDFNSNAIQAVNYQTIITASQFNGELPKAFVQDFNYYSKRSTLPRYEGSKNTVSSFNFGSGYNAQYSVGTYVAYYSAFIATGGSPGPYTGTMVIEYIIAPDGTLIEAINNDENLELLKQNFVNNEFSEGQVQMVATPISSSDTVKITFKDQLRAYSSAKLMLEGKRDYPNYVNNYYEGGIIYPAGIELSTAKDLPQQARQILSDNRII